ncbi:MAG: hypothetical protein HYZ34_10925 [Ignavibacteriae bacterium]|nr:hypothetical protein [Ignavibacteriota bacterium]
MKFIETAVKIQRIKIRLFLLVIISSTFLSAEILPIKKYTTTDGLPQDNINRIVQDSRGFLWFCTADGLSKFDGYSFSNYSLEQGLPHRNINDVLESRSGTYWIATSGGLCEFHPDGVVRSGGPIQFFTVHSLGKQRYSTNVSVIEEDSEGAIWCGTQAGLFRVTTTAGRVSYEFIEIGLPLNTFESALVNSLLFDRRGALWIGTESGLFCRLPNGQIERYTTLHGLPSNGIKTIASDSHGAIFVGTPYGACRLVGESSFSRYRVSHKFTTREGLRNNWVGSSYVSSKGRVWFGTVEGISQIYLSEQTPTVIKTYTKAHGLSDVSISTIMEDNMGNLWFGTESGGAMKLAKNGFTTFLKEDGISNERIGSIIESKSSELSLFGSNMPLFINTFNGDRFTRRKINLPRQISGLSWGWNQTHFQDHLGEWWIQTSQGLCRFPKSENIEQLSNTSAIAVYTTNDGLCGNAIFRLFEDSRGDIWISTLDNPECVLTRWERSSGRFHRIAIRDSIFTTAPTAFREDNIGTLWIGFYGGGLVRIKGEQYKTYTAIDGLPAGLIRDLHFDRMNRLWIATSQGGVGLLDDVQTMQLQFKRFTVNEGLSSNDVRCITEDLMGRIYIGTGRGVDRLDPSTGHIKHFTTADGLANTSLSVAFRDSSGSLWFGTLQGLSRFIPAAEPPMIPPSMYISALRIAGMEQRISELGEVMLSGYELFSDQNNVQIEFHSIGSGAGDVIRYQYILEGAEKEWSLPTSERTVNFASLSPGSYRFVVRAVTSEGLMSEQPASFAFVILPPFWERWWFLTLLFSFVATVLYGVYRLRVLRILEMERLRRRIARDLHDDIGADLTQIAIFSEVIKAKIQDKETENMLERIGTMARRIIGGMSELVWYIDPRHDTVKDIVHRVEEIAGGLLQGKEIRFSVACSSQVNDVKLTPEIRKELFLILKEALYNAVRHSNCSSISLEMKLNGKMLAVELKDDGKGIVPERRQNGHGLENMRKRAEFFGGTLSINSSPDTGTVIRLLMPFVFRHRETTHSGS